MHIGLLGTVVMGYMNENIRGGKRGESRVEKFIMLSGWQMLCNDGKAYNTEWICLSHLA